jgi:hypothetical protein
MEQLGCECVACHRLTLDDSACKFAARAAVASRSGKSAQILAMSPPRLVVCVSLRQKRPLPGIRHAGDALVATRERLGSNPKRRFVAGAIPPSGHELARVRGPRRGVLPGGASVQRGCGAGDRSRTPDAPTSHAR